MQKILGKCKVGQLVRTTTLYKNAYTKSDVRLYGFVWDLGEVYAVDSNGEMRIQIFGPRVAEATARMNSTFFEKVT